MVSQPGLSDKTRAPSARAALFYTEITEQINTVSKYARHDIARRGARYSYISRVSRYLYIYSRLQMDPTCYPVYVS